MGEGKEVVGKAQAEAGRDARSYQSLLRKEWVMSGRRTERQDQVMDRVADRERGRSRGHMEKGKYRLEKGRRERYLRRLRRSHRQL